VLTGTDREPRHRISFYSFNLRGGPGAGSYFQDPVTVGGWIHYAGQFDSVHTWIFKNGVPRDQDRLAGYKIAPRNGTAPVRIGTRDFGSFFQGSIARVAIYSTRLSAATLAAHAAIADAGAYDRAVLSEASLVGYWRLDEATGTVATDARGANHGTYCTMAMRPFVACDTARVKCSSVHVGRASPADGSSSGWSSPGSYATPSRWSSAICSQVR